MRKRTHLGNAPPHEGSVKQPDTGKLAPDYWHFAVNHFQFVAYKNTFAGIIINLL
jgi:hypothetical protein